MRYLLSACLGMAIFTLTGRADTFEDAQKAFGQKKYDDAVKLLDKHLAEKKDDARAYLLRGQAHAASKNLAAAAADFDKAIEFDPKKGIGYLARGKLRSQQQKFDEARADLDKAIELSPKLGVAYVERGNLTIKQAIKGGRKQPEQFADATKDFDAAIKINPKLAEAYFGRARALLEKKPNVAVFMKDGKVYEVLRGYRPYAAFTALPDLDKAAELNPKSADIRTTRANCHETLNDHAKEIPDRKTAAALNMTDAANLNRLAWVLAASTNDKVRDGKAALGFAKAAAKLTKNMDPYILDTLACAQAAAGEFKAAVDTQQKVIALLKSPAKSVFHERLALYKMDRPFHGELDAPLPPGASPAMGPGCDEFSPDES